MFVRMEHPCSRIIFARELAFVRTGCPRSRVITARLNAGACGVISTDKESQSSLGRSGWRSSLLRW